MTPTNQYHPPAALTAFRGSYRPPQRVPHADHLNPGLPPPSPTAAQDAAVAFASATYDQQTHLRRLDAGGGHAGPRH